MKFFVDENIPHIVLDFLVDSGYKIFDIRGTDEEGITDEEIFRESQEKHAVFLTTDKDFFHTIPHKFHKHFGIIVIGLNQPNAVSILKKVIWAVEFTKSHPIECDCLLLTDNRVYYV